MNAAVGQSRISCLSAANTQWFTNRCAAASSHPLFEPPYLPIDTELPDAPFLRDVFLSLLLS
jgi:hypothetical protein